MKTGNALSTALGVENNVEIVLPKKIEEIVVQSDFPDVEEDYKLSRNTFRSLIKKGNDAIDGITDLAKESESPRAYEVLATLMRTVADTTKDLFDLQKKTKDLAGSSSEKKLDETAITIEKAVFVGSTAELLKRVKNNEDI